MVVAPLGFLMGMPFPRGLQSTGRGSFPLPPFYWGLNGIFSVVGSMATMVTAVVFGFTWAMVGGAAFYLVAALASRAFDPAAGRRRADPPRGRAPARSQLPQHLRGQVEDERAAPGEAAGNVHEGGPALLELQAGVVAGAEQPREELGHPRLVADHGHRGVARVRSSTAACSSNEPLARAAVSSGSSRPHAAAAIAAVCLARSQGLVRSASGRSTSFARPSAASRNFCSPSGVSGRSSSGIPGVPRGTAIAWRMMRSCIEWPPARGF